eukprot:Skav202596  [mRNA]  locus=scaffold1305:217486:217776:+ [translate_table: standard]
MTRVSMAVLRPGTLSHPATAALAKKRRLQMPMPVSVTALINASKSKSGAESFKELSHTSKRASTSSPVRRQSLTPARSALMKASSIICSSSAQLTV